MNKIYTLFSGRHELPENLGPICTDFNFDSFKAVRSPLWEKCIDDILDGNKVKIIVTGLTPALTEYLTCVMNLQKTHFILGIPLKGQLSLLHFNASTKEYVEQVYL